VHEPRLYSPTSESPVDVSRRVATRRQRARFVARGSRNRRVACAADRRLELSTLSDYRAGAFDDDPVLLLGYSQLNEASIPRAVAELALVLNSSRLA
jgi:hypothetical protein